MYFIVVHFGMLLILASACSSKSVEKSVRKVTNDVQQDIVSYPAEVVKTSVTGNIVINVTRTVHITNDKFLSVALGAKLLKEHRRSSFIFNSTRVRSLAKALAPAIRRVGGTDADFLIFNDTTTDSNDPDFRTNFTMTTADWDKLNTFASDVGWDLLFDLNMLLRQASGAWDPTNAKTLMKYTLKKGYRIAGWELGNEPNHINHHSNITVSADQLAKDFVILRQLLDQQGFKDSFLVGPDITHPLINNNVESSYGKDATSYLKSFLRGCGNATQAITWHSYYINSQYVTPDNMTSYQMMNTLKKQMIKVDNMIQKYRPHLPKSWLGETAGVSGGGYLGYSNAYAGGFLWLDKLGISAKYGVDLVIRQSFYGGHYGLLDEHTTEPTPGYWISLLYKQLVGPEFLGVNVTFDGKNSNHIRAYAHCTKTTEGLNTANTNGAITLFIINLQRRKSVSLSLCGKLTDKVVYKYQLLPSDADQGIKSKTIALNGLELMLTESGEIPPITGEKLSEGEPISLPPVSYGFYVVEAIASACIGG